MTKVKYNPLFWHDYQRWILEKETISCAISIAMNCFVFLWCTYSATLGPKKRKNDLVSVNKLKSNNPSLVHNHLTVPTYGPNTLGVGDAVRNTSDLDDAHLTTDVNNKDAAGKSNNEVAAGNSQTSTNEITAKIQTAQRPIRATRNPKPSYVHTYTQIIDPQDVVRWS